MKALFNLVGPRQARIALLLALVLFSMAPLPANGRDRLDASPAHNHHCELIVQCSGHSPVVDSANHQAELISISLAAPVWSPVSLEFPRPARHPDSVIQQPPIP